VIDKGTSGETRKGPAPARLKRWLAAVSMACLLAACSAPTGEHAGNEGNAAAPIAADADADASSDATRETPTGNEPTTRPGPPDDIVPPRMSDPLPPEVLPEPVALDRSCRTDADCTVKNVGNCCGYYPSCVNVNSPTDPAAVQAECAARGISSVCGFPEISGCQCVSGQCRDVTGGAAPATE
jgi:hypothetical protein